jgi:hypothetical protein
MLGDGSEQATILRTFNRASGLGPCEQQSRNQESYPHDAGVRRQGEEDSERGQNEQGSGCLEGGPGSFVRRSFTAEPLEPLFCGEIEPMAVGPSQKIAQTISTSRGGAIQPVIPIHKPKLFFITCSDVFAISIVDLLGHGRRSANQRVPLGRDGSHGRGSIARRSGSRRRGSPARACYGRFRPGRTPISSGEVSMENLEARDRDERRKALLQFPDADDTTGSRPPIGSRRSAFPRAHSELRLASRRARTTCVCCFQTCACLTALRCRSAWSGFPSIRDCPYVGFTPSWEAAGA